MAGIAGYGSPAVKHNERDLLRLRHDVLFSQQPDGALFRGAHRAFTARGAGAYAFASLLCPLLDGTRNEADLWDFIPASHRPAAKQIITSLTHHELLIFVDPDDEEASGLSEPVRSEFAHQIAYLSHAVYRPYAAFSQFHRTHIHVEGTAPIVPSIVVGLLRNGAGRVSTAAPIGARELNAAGIRHDGRLTVGGAIDNGLTIVVSGVSDAWRLEPRGPQHTIFPVVHVDEHVIFGPELRAEGIRWDSIGLRALELSDPPAALATALPLAAGAGTRQRFPIYGANATLVGQTAAFSAFRLLTGIDRTTDRPVAMQQNLLSLESVQSAVYPHPLTDAGAATTALTADLPTISELGVQQGEAMDQDAAYAALANSFAPLLGLFKGFDDLEVEQLPVRVGTVRMHTGDRVSSYDLESTRAARLRAGLEAALRYGAAGRHARPRPRTEITQRIVESARFLENLDQAADLGDFLEVTDLVSGDTFAAPFAAVFPAAMVRSGASFELPGSAGAGYTLADAITEAILSAASFVALSGAVTAEVVKVGPAIARTLASLEEANDSELDYLRTTADIEGVQVHVAALAGPAPTWLVWDAQRPEHAVVRSALAAKTALIGAVLELLGRRQAGDVTQRPAPDLLSGAARSAKVVSDHIVDLDTVTSIEQVVERLTVAGYDVLAHRTSSPDVLAATGIDTVRVLLARSDP